MPQFIAVSGQSYSLGAYNPGIVPYISIDLGLTVNGDFQLDPVGNLQALTGNAKLEQDIKLFLLSPRGTSLMDPNWGNPVISLLATAESFQGQIEQAIGQALVALQTYKNAEKTKRPLEASELINSIVNVNVAPETDTSNNIAVTITLTTEQDNMFVVRVPLT